MIGSLLRKEHAPEGHGAEPCNALVSPQKSLNSAIAKLILGEDFGAFDFRPAASARRKQRGGGSTRTL